MVTFLDAASEKTLRSTLALTASRGRGKSAALGLAIAGVYGVSAPNALFMNMVNAAGVVCLIIISSLLLAFHNTDNHNGGLLMTSMMLGRCSNAWKRQTKKFCLTEGST